MADHIQVGDAVPRVQYVANGVQAAFTYPFPIFKPQDLEVWVDDELQLPAVYAVSSAGVSGGGSVLFAQPPAAGGFVTLRRRLSIRRDTDYLHDGLIRAKELNDELDYQTAALQQVAEEASRAVRRSFLSTDAADLTLPEPVGGRALKWNADGSGLENSASDLDTAAASAAAAQASAAIATAKASEASAAQTSVASDAAATHADWIAVTADAAQVAADRAVVAADKALVAADRAAAAASALAASGSETNALAYRNAAQVAQMAAEAARDATLAAYDSFDDRYLGAKASAPTLDNDGNALVGGALYFDTTAGAMQLWTGTAWVAAYVSGNGTLAAANNLADVANPATARSNLAAAAASHGHASTAITDWTEGVQDVVGAMVAAAGGSYNDGAGTIAFPAGGGGDLVKISTATISSPAAYIQFTGLSDAYRTYLVIVENLRPDVAGNVTPELEFRKESGASWFSNIYDWTGGCVNEDGSTSYWGSGADHNNWTIRLCQSLATSTAGEGGYCGHILILNARNPTVYTRVEHHGSVFFYNAMRSFWASGYVYDTSVVDALRIGCGQNILTASATLYGMK
ncbi:hypothetical protein A6A04_01725 [Paramagnetospirillum marisnigri]|uniref:Uncharacterized protein n=1 Tax=Paramagnetospirillum marisnigri TaxID=1285242 RepID=A0A178MQ04_9PROT|nr:hypothetical protein [Paramagnetospirillum marisnigri]OAN50155.1 hypothetical protein A6A04_01725 [Paramagnetospirillum marisnigri]